jgi:hypothetical protein
VLFFAWLSFSLATPYLCWLEFNTLLSFNEIHAHACSQKKARGREKKARGRTHWLWKKNLMNSNKYCLSSANMCNGGRGMTYFSIHKLKLAECAR